MMAPGKRHRILGVYLGFTQGGRATVWSENWPSYLVLVQGHLHGTEGDSKERASHSFIKVPTHSILTLPIQASHSWLSCTEPVKREEMELFFHSVLHFGFSEWPKPKVPSECQQAVPQALLATLGRCRGEEDQGGAIERAVSSVRWSTFLKLKCLL